MPNSPITISVVCGCMDRTEMLQQALPSWLALVEIGQIVIVDWSSREPIRQMAAALGDPRLKVARVDGQRRWILSKSLNLGARVASGDVLLRLDSDHVLQPSFFDTHQLTDGRFFCGNWRHARTDNERHLAGVLYVHRRHFLAVNGYNERIVTYGYEDDDLYERLERAGLARQDIDRDTVHHIPHDDPLRIRHQDVRDVQAETERNKALAHSRPWTMADRMTGWDCRETDGGIVCTKQQGPARNGFGT
jgi:hypothetical protein